MKTLYSSSFISIVLGFLMLMGYNNQPIDIVENPKKIHFKNVIELEELLPFETIKIEIFDDLDCHNCTELIQNTLPKIKDLKQETNEIEIHLFFIPNINDELYSEAAMGLKCAAEQDKYWEMHAKLHEYKKDLNLKLFPQIAEELELNPETFTPCMEEKKYQNDIEEDIKYASEKNITIKPTLIINEYKLIGNQPFENIQRTITRLMKERQKVSPFDIDANTEPTDLELEIETSDTPSEELESEVETSIDEPTDSDSEAETISEE